MFRHKGSYRTKIQNLRLASFLSFVAGAVNVIGFYLFGIMTTHVTGNVVHLTTSFLDGFTSIAMSFMLFLASFLVGSFLANFFLELGGRKRVRYRYVLLVFTEVFLLILVLVSRWNLIFINENIQVALLFMTMGIQNALVTWISNSVVRTTHLTGMFTDLGIELSQLIFYRKKEERMALKSSIQLRLFIILFFFLGCFIGGILYYKWNYTSLILPIITLLIALWYSDFKYLYLYTKRKIRRLD